MFRWASRVLRQLLHRIEMRRYDEFTIADYFRKQGARIGPNTRICISELAAEPYLIRIGANCLISTQVSFNTHDGGVSIFRSEDPSIQRFGTIEIFDNCMIGNRATILPGVRIGPNSVVGAGSVVTKDVPAGVVAAGNPARVIEAIGDYREKALLDWSRQKPVNYMPEIVDGGEYAPSFVHTLKRRDEKLLREHLMHALWGDRGRAP